MSKFGRRLERLGPEAPRGAAVNTARAAPAEEDPAPATAASAPPASPLDDLRARLEALVAKPTMTAHAAGAAAHQARRATEHDDLPFTASCEEHGVVHARILRYEPAHAVGVAPLAAAATAHAEILSLLAQDPALATRAPAGALYLDTETTGLSGGTGTIAFLVGLAYVDAAPASAGPARYVVEQFLVRDLGEESGMLAVLARRIAAATMLVTFNGKSFDWPLLRTRFLMHRMTPPALPPHLDLVHVARRIHRDPMARSRSGTRLVDLESRVLGFERQGDISGAEIPAVYMHYLRTRETEAMHAVVTHNVWDVLAMVALVGLYGEPLASSRLDGSSLAGVARGYARASRLDLALEHSETALARGGAANALDARARIHKARAARAEALADFEALARQVDSPAVRLELAKLYEHHAKDFARAAAATVAGTGETPQASERRLERLRRKQFSNE